MVNPLQHGRGHTSEGQVSKAVPLPLLCCLHIRGMSAQPHLVMMRQRRRMEAAGAHRQDVSMTCCATLFLTLSGLCRLVMMCFSMLTTGHCADHVWHSASNESHDGSHTEGIGKTDL